MYNLYQLLLVIKHKWKILLLLQKIALKPITSMQQPKPTEEVKSSSQVQHEASTQSISSSTAVTQEGDLNSNNGPSKPEEKARRPSSSSVISSMSDANDHSDNKTEPSSLQKFFQVLEEVFKYIWKVIKSIGKELNNHKFPIVFCGAIGGVIGFFVGAIPGIFVGIGVGAAIGYGISKCFCTTITNQKIEDSKDQLTTGEELSAPSVQLSTSTQPQV
ncbi:MAG: hypothetical protein PG981_000877 [Wolbachia endosymbiont of Ctenocephalides orientis wCori]|nr:MAG: hypothetical protein PG981_000877 [Wolbachia endosymbiont of Ctenocephalides orientis wCori]